MKINTIKFVECVGTGECVTSYKEYGKTEYWKTLSKRLRSERGKCEMCGDTENLGIHHTTYENIGDEDETLLRVLCWSCHSSAHRMPGTIDYASSHSLPEQSHPNLAITDKRELERYKGWKISRNKIGERSYGTITATWIANATSYDRERVLRDARENGIDFSNPAHLASYIISSTVIARLEKGG